MKFVFATAVGVTSALAFTVGTATGGRVPERARPGPHPSYGKIGGRGIPTNELSSVIQHTCLSCHNDVTMKGNLSLKGYDVDSAYQQLDVSEKMIRKLRAQIMPPPGSKRPGGDTLVALVETLEKVIDSAARPNPGTRTFQRLNRPE